MKMNIIKKQKKRCVFYWCQAIVPLDEEKSQILLHCFSLVGKRIAEGQSTELPVIPQKEHSLELDSIYKSKPPKKNQKRTTLFIFYVWEIEKRLSKVIRPCARGPLRRVNSQSNYGQTAWHASHARKGRFWLTGNSCSVINDQTPRKKGKTRRTRGQTIVL